MAPAKGKEYQRFQCEILGNLKWRNRPKLEDFRYTDVSRYFDLTYGNCYFVKGLELLREGDLVGASEALELSTEISPYNPRYKERLCFVYEQLNRQQREKCTEELDQLLEHVNDQYLVLKQ